MNWSRTCLIEYAPQHIHLTSTWRQSRDERYQAFPIFIALSSSMYYCQHKLEIGWTWEWGYMNWSRTYWTECIFPPAMSTLHLPDVSHLMKHTRPSLFLLLFPLPCNIVNANQRTKNVGLGTRLHAQATKQQHSLTKTINLMQSPLLVICLLLVFLLLAPASAGWPRCMASRMTLQLHGNWLCCVGIHQAVNLASNYWL